MRLNKRVTVTNSELQTFRSCRQLWDFTYRHLLHPKRSARPLAVGSAIHGGLAGMYRFIYECQKLGINASTDEVVNAAHRGMNNKLAEHLQGLYEKMEADPRGLNIDELVDESRATEAEVEGTVLRYVEAFASDMQNYRVLAVEQAFAVPMLADDGRATPRLMYRGVFDLVLFDPNIGDVILCEHKSTAGDARLVESKIDMDPQTTGYIWTLSRRGFAAKWKGAAPELYEHLDAPVGRVFYNVLRKSGPKQPKWTKDGTLSAAACDTTRDVYEAALRIQEERGGPREDGKPVGPKPRSEKQIEVLNAMSNDTGKWMKRHEVWHSQEEQQRWRREVVVEGGQIRRAIAGKLPVIRNPGHCNMPWSMPCAFRGICRHDTPAGRELDFRTVPNPHMEVIESEEEQGGTF